MGYSHAQLKRFSKKTDYCCCTQTVQCVYCAGQGKPVKEQPTREKTMKTPHKHAELIKAWADGAEIECRRTGGWDVAKTWEGTPHPTWALDIEYRIKPDPQPSDKALALLANLAVSVKTTEDGYPQAYAALRAYIISLEQGEVT